MDIEDSYMMKDNIQPVVKRIVIQFSDEQEKEWHVNGERLKKLE